MICVVLVLGISPPACTSNSPVAANSNAVTTNSPVTESTDGSNISVGQKVTFESADKTVIVGTFFESTKPNSPAVLLLHQFGSDRHSYDDFAKQLQAKGFGVLAIDGRGFGESTKKSDGTAIAVSRSDDAVKGMLSDVGAAFDFLSKQKNVDAAKIGIVGASYGSSLALIYGADHSKGVVIALLSPGLNYFGNMPTEPALQKYGSDCAIFMAAAKDDPESAKAVDTLVNQWTQPEKITRVVKDSGGHGTALLKTGANKDLQDFLSKYLAPTK